MKEILFAGIVATVVGQGLIDYWKGPNRLIAAVCTAVPLAILAFIIRPLGGI